ncbi:MAG: hypothetical protein JO277_09900, partial [Candidatus Eremiobacteraeota bacterium]|nr:hypothetical protein [Candidatus Eremiobacteraeota bacterium]
MMARRRRGLGRSPEAHAKEAGRAQDMATMYARKAHDHAEAKRCGLAFDDLVNAAQWNGIETVHAIDGGKGRSTSAGSVHRAV